MKTITTYTIILLAVSLMSKAQTSPPSASYTSFSGSLNSFTLGDTITFSPYAVGTIMNTQYQNEGIIFSGYNGSTDPSTFDYGPTSYGSVLISDNWFNPFRMNFVDSANSSRYCLAKRIEFDNVIAVTEVDFMSIDVYDSMDVLIYHYLSASPEHVILDFNYPAAAYIIIDDSASTAYVVDNILIDLGNLTSVNDKKPDNFKLYPNPFSDQLNVSDESNEASEFIMYDNFSRVIYRELFTKNLSVNTEQLAKGIYIYEVRNKVGVNKKGKVVKY